MSKVSKDEKKFILFVLYINVHHVVGVGILHIGRHFNFFEFWNSYAIGEIFVVHSFIKYNGIDIQFSLSGNNEMVGQRSVLFKRDLKVLILQMQIYVCVMFYFK